MPATSEPYHPHWKDSDGVVHVGSFTGPFTACGRNWNAMAWQHREQVPATCVACIDYMSRRP